MKKLTDFYVLVNKKEKTILCPAQELLENWTNISGLNLLSDEKLLDLEWAGHPNMGWIKFFSNEILSYSYTDEWFDITKNNIKSFIANQRWEKETEVLFFEENQIIMDEKTKSSLQNLKSFLDEGQDVVWKFRNGFSTLTYDEFVKLYNFSMNYIQDCFKEEYRLINLISSITTLEDLINIDLTETWPINVF